MFANDVVEKVYSVADSGLAIEMKFSLWLEDAGIRLL